MKKVVFSIFCVVFSLITPVFAQKQGNVWHFGRGAALDFNSGSAVVTTPSSMETFEGSASICDENGNLLFYTNGGGRPQLSGQPSGKIWNRNHEVMYDMSFTEGGGFSAAQSSVIIPKPGAAGKYLLFTMDETEFNVGGSVSGQPQGRGLSYFEVDMTLNGGLGGVSHYTESILVPSFEGLCLVRHSNGSDYWIVVHNGQSGLAVFPVNNAGVGAPQFFPVVGGTSRQIKGSPDGKWIATVSFGSLANVLIPFNAATGTLGTPLSLSVENVSWEFSPNSQRLYAINFDNDLGYYDLTSANTALPFTVVDNVPAIGGVNGQMQLAPDGKIYFVQTSFPTGSIFLSAIVCPNSSPFLELQKLAFPIVDGNTFLGLPNFDNALFRRDDDPPLPVSLGTNPTLCAGQTLVLNPGIANATYTWSNGAQTPTLTVATPGTYAVTVSVTGCGAGVDTVVVQAGISAPNAGTNTNICAGAELPLLGSGTGTLSWSPANAVSDPAITNPMFTGNSTTTLVLTATENGCSASDTVVITVFPTPTVSVSPMDSTIIAGASVGLNATSNATVLEWSPAVGLSCTDCPNPVATPEISKTYFVTVTNNDGCTASASFNVEVIPPDCTVEMPNAFTPNSDANNDVFAPVGKAIEAYNLRIFNRWGQQVYTGEAGWNGTLDRDVAPMDVYVYKINIQVCGTQSEFLGEVTLIR